MIDFFTFENFEASKLGFLRDLAKIFLAPPLIELPEKSIASVKNARTSSRALKIDFIEKIAKICEFLPIKVKQFFPNFLEILFHPLQVMLQNITKIDLNCKTPKSAFEEKTQNPGYRTALKFGVISA